jgi:hypothetical protein
MSELTDGIIDTETTLVREIDTLSECFPQVSRQDLENDVRAAYQELEQQAHVAPI